MILSCDVLTGVSLQRQEMTASTETLDGITDSTPQALPYHSNTSTLRSADSPKRDATEMYLKSKALLESRRKCKPTSLLSKGVFFNLKSSSTWSRPHALIVLLIHRASHQRHWCLSEERHWNRLWIPCPRRRRSTTASKYICNTPVYECQAFKSLLWRGHKMEKDIDIQCKNDFSSS